MKKVCSITLALLLTLTTVIPGFASEADPEAALSSAQDAIETTQPEQTEPPVEAEPPTIEEPEQTEPPAETEPPTPEEPEQTEPPAETEPPTPEELEQTEPPAEPEPPTLEEPEQTEPPAETEPSTPEESEPPEPEEPVPPEPPTETESPEPEEPELPEPPAEDESAELEEPSEDLDTEMDDAPVIQVTVSRSGRVIINPYSLPVEIGDEISTDQITSETMTICNTSSVPVVVSASVVGYISELSSMTFASSPVAPDSKDKSIFLYAEFQNEDGLWCGEFDCADNQILICEDISTATDVLTLDAGSSEGAFRIFGGTSVHPAEPWSEDDCFSVTFMFTFSPIVSVEEVPDTLSGQPTLNITESEEPCDMSEILLNQE